MKLLSVAVPCYNSAAYMRKCVESLLPGGDEIEILVVDDGSTKDNTLEIAQQLEAEHPGIVRAIHQENAGHGGAVTTGMRNATGAYFKVVDSDDWVNSEVLLKILDLLRGFVQQKADVDMLVSNYVYDKVGVKHKKVMRYNKVLQQDKILTWNEVNKLPLGVYIMMHSVIYRTAMLQEHNIALPTHCFYVDNIYVFEPMQYVKKLYYADLDFYHYFIGRNDQSVNESVMIKRIDQQLRVNHEMVERVRLEKISPETVQQYMFHYLEIITMISTLLLLKMDTEEAAQKRKDLWGYIEKRDPWLYKHLRKGLMGHVAFLPGRFGRAVTLAIYNVTQKIYGFN